MSGFRVISGAFLEESGADASSVRRIVACLSEEFGRLVKNGRSTPGEL
jgi:hypothetical protein